LDDAASEFGVVFCGGEIHGENAVGRWRAPLSMSFKAAACLKVRRRLVSNKEMLAVHESMPPTAMKE
jgi:hypothetical protein